MTKEEFYKLAENPPQADVPSICKMTIYAYRRDVNRYWYNPKTKLWGFPIFTYSSHYSTLEEAKKAMREELKNPLFSNGIHHVDITRYPIDVRVGDDAYLNWWLFDSSGNELDRSVCSSFTCDISIGIPLANHGRFEKDCRSKPGEIVEVCSETKCWLAVASDGPISVDDAFERYCKMLENYGELPDGEYNPDYFFDSMSDSFFVIEPNGFDPDYSSSMVFKPTFALPEKAIEQLNGVHERWTQNVGRVQNGEIDWDQLYEIVKVK